MTDFREAHRLSFGPAAELYDRARPSYPAEALRFALGDTPVRVVDLGAGTGLLTRALVELGHEVLPVEPDPRMRAQLDSATPGVTALAGSAESIPLPDASVDAVVVGQAYHWFDQERAHPEIARVLRPGGVFAPMWNERDESVSWVAELWRLIGRAGQEPAEHDFGPLFGPIEVAKFRHVTRHTVATLLELVRSRSYYLTASAERRAEIEAAVHHLAATHPDLRDHDEYELAYITEVHRAYRAP